VPAKPATPASGAPQPPTPGRTRRPVPSIERALSGPAADRIDSWQRRVRVVPGGQGPGKRDQETLDQARAQLPLAGPRRIVFLGCTSGAGQTMTALVTGQLLVALRGDPVAALDLSPGQGSLTRQAQASPALTVAALLASTGSADVVSGGPVPASPASASPASASPVPASPVPARPASASPVPASTGHSPWARFDIITSDADSAAPAAPGERDYARLAERAGRLYPLMVIDPGASEVTRVLGVADQLVLVAPASADASRSLAMTQEWLGNNGHRELAARAVTVINRVSRASLSDVEQAEAVARGRCRAIVRIPWDDGLAGGGPEATGSAGPAARVSSLRPQVRHAYTALAGVLVAGLAAAPVPRKVLH
jgi:MinD-like ATPase involved in chromosome partitioning or flagellar assembly